MVDIVIEKDRIASVQPKAPDKGRREIDAAGSLVLPGLFNLHFHADKCLLGEIMRPNLSGTLPEAIEITNDFKRKYDPAEVAERTLRVLETGVKNGTTFSGCSRTSARSAAFVPHGVCCSPVKSSGAIARSRSLPFRRKASSAIRARRNCSMKR